MIPQFTLRTLLAAIEQAKPARRFLVNTFFSNTETSLTEAVDFDVVDGVRKLAPFVHPLHEGKPVDRQGFEAKTFKPPYIKELRQIRPGDLFARLAGEAIYAQMSPEQRLAEILRRDMEDAIETIERREEWMAAQILATGSVHVQGEGVDAVINFGRHSDHTVALGAGVRWNEETGTPLANVRAWRRMISRRTGLTAGIGILGSDALEAFLENEQVTTQMDLLRQQQGQINLAELPEGVTFVGNLPGIQLFAYDEWYVDPADGDEKPMIGAKDIIIGAANSQATRHYGAIQDLEAGGLAAMPFFPKSWDEQNPSVRNTLVQSAPLPAPKQTNAFLKAQVLE